MHYRREIDGLRALAVLPVILFHAGFATFGGGFVGVDVFFVISGYLITGIIAEEVKSGTFTLAGFYERRARRILPALFLVMLACLPLAWVWLLPQDMKSFSQSLVAVALFASNILFWKTSGYFDTAGELKPLLHTWSLAVEEQFYLIFPILFLLIWRFGRRWMLGIFGLLLVASLVAADRGSTANPASTFYLLPTRGWELLIGALVALYGSALAAGLKSNRGLGEAASALGLLMIGYATFAFGKETPFPSAYALLPTVGTALIILFATPETIVGRVLGNRVLVGIGLISYSAYLWHQPLLAFARQRLLEEPSPLLLGALAAASLPLAYLTWRYVETPFRDRSRLSRRQIAVFSVAGSMLFVAIGLAGHMTRGYGTRFAGKAMPLVDFAEENTRKRAESCRPAGSLYPKPGVCTLGARDNMVGTLMGDSHALMLWQPMDEALSKRKIGFYSFAEGNCPPVRNVYRVDNDADAWCRGYNEDAWRFVTASQELKYIVLSARWSIYIEKSRYDNGEGGVEKGVDSYLDVIVDGVKQRNAESERRRLVLARYTDSVVRFLEAGKKVVLVYPTPEVGWDVPLFYNRSLLFRGGLADPYMSHSYERYLNRNRAAIAALDAIGEHKNLLRVKPASMLCGREVKDRCVAVSNGVLLYADDDHLSNVGARMVVDEIMKFVE